VKQIKLSKDELPSMASFLNLAQKFPSWRSTYWWQTDPWQERKTFVAFNKPGLVYTNLEVRYNIVDSLIIQHVYSLILIKPVKA
jgi:hypothetical protein